MHGQQLCELNLLYSTHHQHMTLAVLLLLLLLLLVITDGKSVSMSLTYIFFELNRTSAWSACQQISTVAFINRTEFCIKLWGPWSKILI